MFEFGNGFRSPLNFSKFAVEDYGMGRLTCTRPGHLAHSGSRALTVIDESIALVVGRIFDDGIDTDVL
jgi:hypothetical protein